MVAKRSGGLRLVALTCGVVLGFGPEGGEVRGAPPLAVELENAGATASWRAAAARHLAADERRPHPVAGGFALQGGGVRVRLTPDGVEVDGWRLDFGQGALQEPRASGNRVEYQRSPQLVEWYEARETGIEQGFTVLRRPEGDLRLVGTIDGPAPTRAGFQSLRMGHLLYADLAAMDASGHRLDAELRWDEVSKQLTLRIPESELEGAEFPVTVDPLLSNSSWTSDPTNQAFAYFGMAVATAGDVNGDGFADVVAGADQWGINREGRAYLYLGGATGLALLPSWTADPANMTNAGFGFSVASAGDVNGDGFADVVVGAPGWGVREGRAYVYLGGATGLASTPAWTADPTDQFNASFGSRVASAGDVNGDGFADLVVGAADWAAAGGPAEGRAYLYLGSSAGLASVPAWTADPADEDVARFGFSLASAGDVNGDGLADVVVGAYAWTSVTNLEEGRVWLYLGTGTGLSLAPAWVLDPTDQDGARFGFSLASAGDVNGDGFADVVVGSDRWNGQVVAEGRAFLYLGGAGGLGTTAAWTDDPTNQPAGFGNSVAGAGDVNGDGFADVLVGARDWNGEAMGEGRAWLYLGSANGLAAAAWTADPTDQAVASFGASLAGAGDVNGDGFADVVVGAFGWNGQALQEGKAWLYEGSATGLAITVAPTADPTDQVSAWFGYSLAGAGDVNGDGLSDVVVGSFGWDGQAVNEGRASLHLGGAPAFSPLPFADPTDQADAWFGYSVAGAGDVNGDGFADVVVGAYGWDGVAPDEGRAWLYQGNATGLAAPPAWTADPTDQAGASFGISVAAAGDVNGDGFADVLVGSQRWNGQAAGEGRAWLYLGSAAGLSPAAAWTADPTDQGGAAFGISVAGAGDVNGDGFADVIVGADGWNGQAMGEGRAWLYLGSPLGLSTSAFWTADPTDQAGAEFGASVASAGDVNGDGFADVVVGARGWDGSLPDEGRAFLYLGSATGLSAAPAWSAEPTDQGQGRFGASVASAGDVNGDGLDDVVVGSPGWTGAALGEGRAWLYFGSTTGLTSMRWTSDPSDQLAALFGISVAGAGDVNGDGFGDVVVGAVDWDGQAIDEGRAWLYLGGDLDAPGLRRRLGQYGSSGLPLRLGGRTDDLGVVLRGRVTQEASLGGRLRLEVEVKPVGSSFDGAGTAFSLAVPGGQEASVSVGGLAPNAAYRWRARVVYPVASGAGRWVSFGANGEAQPDFWTPGVLPDAGPSDAGSSDGGPLDAGPLDGGPLDGGPLDGGPLDAGPLDAGPLDGGPLDAGPLDAGPSGSACTAPSECGSGYCVDGVCCDSACAGACDTCSVDGGGSVSGTCVLLGPTVACRPSAGACDLAETCGGSSACPADGVAGAGAVCRVGSSEVASACDGTSAACPDRGPLHLRVGCSCASSGTYFPWEIVLMALLQLSRSPRRRGEG